MKYSLTKLFSATACAGVLCFCFVNHKEHRETKAALQDVDNQLQKWFDVDGITHQQRTKAVYDLVQTRRDANLFWDKNANWNDPNKFGK